MLVTKSKIAQYLKINKTRLVAQHTSCDFQTENEVKETAQNHSVCVKTNEGNVRCELKESDQVISVKFCGECGHGNVEFSDWCTL